MKSQNESKESHKSRGGQREGAGRKRTKGKRNFTFRPDEDLEAGILACNDRSRYINGCIRREQTAARPAEITFIPLKIEDKVAIPYSEQRLVAGFPNPVDDAYIESSIDLNREFIENPASTFCARVTGDSMIDAGVKAGDYLLIDKLKEPLSTSLVVCCLNGEFTLKYVKREEKGVWLVPANKKYTPIPVGPEDDFRVWGVVTGIIRKV